MHLPLPETMNRTCINTLPKIVNEEISSLAGRRNVLQTAYQASSRSVDYLLIWSPGKKKKKKKKNPSHEGQFHRLPSDRCLLLLFLSLWPCLLVWPLREPSRTLWFIGCLSRGKQERCERLIAQSYNKQWLRVFILFVFLLLFFFFFFCFLFQLLLLPPFLFSLFT